MISAGPSFDELIERHSALEGTALIETLATALPGRIALVSSFGVESAVLLALAAEVDPGLPVLFLETGKHFGETLRYRDQVASLLGLTDLRVLAPRDAEARDPAGDLWLRDPDACCALRKVAPLAEALTGFDGWITGRKRYQGAERTALPVLEQIEGRLKVNPLANWSRDRVTAEFTRRGLPRHPLEADGFTSIGCMPCSSRAAPGETERAGRWRGTAKTECGIHHPLRETVRA